MPKAKAFGGWAVVWVRRSLGGQGYDIVFEASSDDDYPISIGMQTAVSLSEEATKRLLDVLRTFLKDTLRPSEGSLSLCIDGLMVHLAYSQGRTPYCRFECLTSEGRKQTSISFYVAEPCVKDLVKELEGFVEKQK